MNKITTHLDKIFDCYAIIALVVGFFIFGWMVLLFFVFFMLISFDVHKKNQKKIGKNVIILIILFLGVFLFGFYQDIKKHSNIIYKKENLYKIEGTIPKKPTRVAIGRTHEYFLTLDNKHFYCGDDKRRHACQLMYEYYGKNATIYYQYGNNHHRAYEIITDDKVIYSFCEQVDYFIKKQTIAKRKFIYFGVLYVMPLLLFIFLIKLHNHQVKYEISFHQELIAKDIDDWLGFGVLCAFLVVLAFGYYLLKF
ncbi:hypothetical protein [Moraxella oblonga]|uniref:hypothetical protein n=1 Tax=Moraxella oblonga TaxID=200413 RepID=UPI0012EE3195|nr:hypothetical protein [Moraxella oblonga]